MRPGKAVVAGRTSADPRGTGHFGTLFLPSSACLQRTPKLKRQFLVLAILAAATIGTPADAARVRVHHSSGGATTSPVELNMPTLPPLDMDEILGRTLTISVHNTPLLDSAGKAAKELAKLKAGTKVRKVAIRVPFYEVETTDKVHGFVRMTSVRSASSAPAAKPKLTLAKAVEVTELPGAGPKVGALKAGDQVEQVLSMGLYWKIKLASGKTGYVLKTAVK